MIGTAWRHDLATRGCHLSFPKFWVLYESPGGDEHTLGDTSNIGSIFGVLGFWVDSDQGKRELYLLVDYWMPDIVELRCDWKLIRGNRMNTGCKVWEIGVIDVMGLMGV